MSNRSLRGSTAPRLADLTRTRAAHFGGALVYVDHEGRQKVFLEHNSRAGTIAREPSGPLSDAAWSVIWNVFVPVGEALPLSSLTGEARNTVFAEWALRSRFAALGRWLATLPTPEVAVQP